MGFFDKIKEGLRKTRGSITGQIGTMLNSFTETDEELFGELEELFIMGDVGITTSAKICEGLRVCVKKNGVINPSGVRGLPQGIISEMLGGGRRLQLTTKPSVTLIIGVNGVGKATTIDKLAVKLSREDKKVILGTAGTLQAVAINQLQAWVDHVDVPMVKHTEGFDPAAVVFDIIAVARVHGIDVVICDTVRRLYNRKYLMGELSKISRIIDCGLLDCDKEVLLVLDVTTGQNAVNQAREFQNAAGLTGIVFVKLDGTAHGGVVPSIQQELGLPVKLINLGERMDDLQSFEADGFAAILFEREAE